MDDLAVQLALRARLATMDICTTGSVSIAIVPIDSVSSKFVRTVGSFADDGFWRGMELVSSGFTTGPNNTDAAILDVDELEMTVNRVLAPEGAAPGRTLAVGMPGKPNRVAWENLDFVAKANTPFLDEQYVPGPVALTSIGSFGRVVAEPQYQIGINVPAKTGKNAIDLYAQNVIDLFPPSDVIALGNNLSVHIRADAAPFKGQLQNNQQFPGFARVLCTIPCRCYSINSI